MKTIITAAVLAILSQSCLAAWSYSTEKDKMDRGERHSARLVSSNKVVFGFPYSGGSSGLIMLRVDPKYGKDAMFAISKGQILCRFRECSFTVRFDGGKPTPWQMLSSGDGSADTVFFSDYARFVTLLKKSKRVQIEALFYQSGNEIFDFDVSGLVWK